MEAERSRDLSFLAENTVSGGEPLQRHMWTRTREETRHPGREQDDPDSDSDRQQGLSSRYRACPRQAILSEACRMRIFIPQSALTRGKGPRQRSRSRSRRDAWPSNIVCFGHGRGGQGRQAHGSSDGDGVPSCHLRPSAASTPQREMRRERERSDLWRRAPFPAEEPPEAAGCKGPGGWPERGDHRRRSQWEKDKLEADLKGFRKSLVGQSRAKVGLRQQTGCNGRTRDPRLVGEFDRIEFPFGLSVVMVMVSVVCASNLEGDAGQGAPAMQVDQKWLQLNGNPLRVPKRKEQVTRAGQAKHPGFELCGGQWTSSYTRA